MHERTFRLLLSSLLTLALLAVGAAASAADVEPFDHLKCFRIRDSLTDRRTILLADLDLPAGPFADRTDCRITLPARHFCTNAQKSNVLNGGEPVDTIPIFATDAHDYLCYDLRCDRDRPDLTPGDQFGFRPIRIRNADYLCVPANVIPPGPTPSPGAPTPTMTPEPMPTGTPSMGCMLSTDTLPTCGGDCPSLSDACLWDGDSCECVPADQACEPDFNRGPGLCSGFCSGQLETCVTNVGDIPQTTGDPNDPVPVTCRCELMN